MAASSASTDAKSKTGLDVKEAIARMFNAGNKQQAEWYGSSFLAAIPLAKMNAIVESIINQVGELQQVKATGPGEFDVLFTGGKAHVTGALDHESKFIGFRIMDLTPTAKGSVKGGRARQEVRRFSVRRQIRRRLRCVGAMP